MAKLRTKLYTLYRRMTRLERAVLVLLCVFAVKFVCSTAAHFVPGLQAVDMLGSGRNPVDIWLLLLSCAAVLGVFCLYRRAAQAVGAKLTKADAVILGICIAASAAFYLHAMVGRQSLYLWDNATYYNLQVRLESNFADGVFTGVGSTIYKTWFNDYAPLVINLLAEPFFMFTPRTANTFALLCALLLAGGAFGYVTLDGKLQEKQAEIDRLQEKTAFFDRYAVCVNDDGSMLYHRYGCARLEPDQCRIYSRKTAEAGGYEPCPDCFGS